MVNILTILQFLLHHYITLYYPHLFAIYKAVSCLR